MLQFLARSCRLAALLTAVGFLPLPAGAADVPPPLCEKPPLDDEILRRLPRLGVSVPGVSKVYRSNVQIVNERLVDQLDPPRDCPFLGKVQLHHCHWQCSVYFDAVIDLTYPFRLQLKKQCAESFLIRQLFVHPVTETPLVPE